RELNNPVNMYPSRQIFEVEPYPILMKGQAILLGDIFDIDQFEGISSSIIGLFVEVLPFLYALAIIISNLSLILGGITYLLDEREENGKWMIARALSIITLFIFLFNDVSLMERINSTRFDQIETFTSYISMYLLFILATLSLIYLIGNCGLYLMNQERNFVKNIRKSIICLLVVILPLGNHFPQFPVWKW
ncbi:MAG: hypothetical protein ACW99R_02250, partial [Candidatus Hodarchaeales archaeon]